MSCVIVLGCYRSGTSAVAGILQRLGVMMGKNFDPPAANNPKGFYEDLDFKDLFDRMSDGRDVDGLLSVLVRMRDVEYPLWGVKDPQLCVYLPRLLPFLKDHRLISTLRSKEDISRSLCKAAFGSDDKQFMPLVEHYLRKKDESLAVYDGPVLEVDFEQLKADPKAGVQRIADFCSLEVNEDAVEFMGID
jgi:hypothetical protein